MNRTVRSVPLRDGERVEGKRRPTIGFIRPGQIERAFTALLYSALFLLVLLSILGTFYGLLGENAPIAAPLFVAIPRIVRSIAAAPNLFGEALVIQLILTLIQYGARQYAKNQPYWWIAYLVSLGVSVYYNYLAYWTPLNTLAPAYLAALIIIAGDVLPEFIAVRRE